MFGSVRTLRHHPNGPVQLARNSLSGKRSLLRHPRAVRWMHAEVVPAALPRFIEAARSRLFSATVRVGEAVPSPKTAYPIIAGPCR